MAVYTNSTYVQFDQATNLNNLLAGLAPYLTINEDTFYNDFFNINTCIGDGLDNWGKLLNLPRVVYTPDLTECFGFDTGEAPTPLDTGYPQNFDNGNFWGGQMVANTLTDEQYRLLLRLKYFSLNTNASLGALNYCMNVVVQLIDPAHKAKFVETGLMELTLEVNFYFNDLQYAIFNDRAFMPIPLGVDYIITQGVVL